MSWPYVSGVEKICCKLKDVIKKQYSSLMERVGSQFHMIKIGMTDVMIAGLNPENSITLAVIWRDALAAMVSLYHAGVWMKEKINGITKSSTNFNYNYKEADMSKVNLYVIFLVFLLSIFVPINRSLADEPLKLDCFSIIVGKDASFDGSVLLAHNEDDFGDQILNMYKVPGQSYNPGDSVTFKNGGKTAQIFQTNGFIWLQLPKMEVSDAFITENGVTVASNGCPSREDSPELTDGGIVYWVRRLAAERAKSARHGVKLIGSLIEKYGYASSGRTYVIADKNEGWMLAAVHGKHWIAQRVPDDMAAVIPNYYTIGKIDLADTTQFFGSSDIIAYAKERSWYNPDKDGLFDFARAYTAETSINHPGNTHRMLRGINLLAEKKYTLDDELPFAFKPKKKITIDDIKSVLRDHYEGCEFDKSENYILGNPHKLNNSTICSGSTQFSIIAHLRSGMSAEIGTVVWIAPFRPGVHAYTPWYPGIESVPCGYAYTDHKSALEQQFNPPDSIFKKNTQHNYWKFTAKVERVDQNFKENIMEARERYDDLEKQILEQQTRFENKVIQMYQSDPKKARKLLTDFSVKWAKKALNDE